MLTLYVSCAPIIFLRPSPGAPSRPAQSPRPVVFSCSRRCSCTSIRSLLSRRSVLVCVPWPTSGLARPITSSSVTTGGGTSRACS